MTCTKQQQELISDCATLASGTMATLTGQVEYEKIEEIQTAFVIWVMENSSFANWMKAWEAFETC